MYNPSSVDERDDRRACKHPHYTILQHQKAARFAYDDALSNILAVYGPSGLNNPDYWAQMLSSFTNQPGVLGLVFYSLYRMKLKGNPVWQLDRLTAMSLAATDPPDDDLTAGLNTYLVTPYPAFYLKLPGGIGLTVEGTSRSGKTQPVDVEGVYISKGPGGELAMVSVAKCAKNGTTFGFASYVLTPSGSNLNTVSGILRFYSASGQNNQGIVFRLVVNFLYALNAGYMKVTSGEPVERDRSRRRRRGLKTRAASKSITFVSLNKKAEEAERDRRSQDKGRRAGTSNYWVRGHWHGYWVSRPKGEPVLAEKVSAKGTALYLIKKLIPAYVVGDPSKAGSPQYRSNPR